MLYYITEKGRTSSTNALNFGKGTQTRTPWPMAHGGRPLAPEWNSEAKSKSRLEADWVAIGGIRSRLEPTWALSLRISFAGQADRAIHRYDLFAVGVRNLLRPKRRTSSALLSCCSRGLAIDCSGQPLWPLHGGRPPLGEEPHHQPVEPAGGRALPQDARPPPVGAPGDGVDVVGHDESQGGMHEDGDGGP